MKNRVDMDKKILWNPFEHCRESTLLVFGVIITIAGSLVATICNARYDGVLDMHLVPDATLLQPLLDNVINIVALLVTLFGLGKIVNGKTRLIDILIAAMVARTPLYLLPLFNIGGMQSEYLDEVMEKALTNPTDISGEALTVITLFGLLALLIIIYYLLFLWKGFKVATNSKKGYHIALFIVCVLLAEVLSKYIIVSLNY